MRISDKYFNQLNPSYQVAVKELEQKLDEYEDNDAKSTEVMLDFSTMYLMPLEYWDEIKDNTDSDEILKKNALRAYYHYFFHFDYLDNPKAYRLHKTLNFAAEGEVGYKPIKSDLSFPHSHINEIFYKIESESNRALPKDLVKLYESNKKLYDDIKAVEDDVEEWFKLLCAAADKNRDQEFVTHKVEYRLGSNLLDTKLWKLYIEYLREHDPAEMLQVYSKYCRFFLNDAEMKERYKQEVKKYGPVYVPWKKAFDFEHEKADGVENENEIKDKEFTDVNELSDEKETENQRSNEDKSRGSEVSSVEGSSAPKRFKPSQLENEDQNNVKSNNSERAKTIKSASQSIDISLLCKNFYETFQLQNFAFKKPIISCILEKANVLVLKKLHQSCKYFYDRKRTPLCHRLLSFDKKTQFSEESLLLNYNTFDLNEILKETIVTTTFNAQNIPANFCSSVISKLYRCDAKYIYIECNLSVSEMKFLLESRNAIIFHWWNSNDNTNAPKLEDITQYLPKIEDLEIVSVIATSQTFATISNQKFLSKIYSLYLHEIHGEAFNVDDLWNIQNREEYFKLNMEFEQSFPDRDVFVTNINERVESEIPQKNADIFID